MRKLTEEAIQLFDGGDTRSFEEIYAGRGELFEDVDDIIDPKMKKLFEATYQVGNIQNQKRLKEDLNDGFIEDPFDEFMQQVKSDYPRYVEATKSDYASIGESVLIYGMCGDLIKLAKCDPHVVFEHHEEIGEGQYARSEEGDYEYKDPKREKHYRDYLAADPSHTYDTYSKDHNMYHTFNNSRMINNNKKLYAAIEACGCPRSSPEFKKIMSRYERAEGNL